MEKKPDELHGSVPMTQHPGARQILVNSRTARATYWDPVSKKQYNNKEMEDLCELEARPNSL